jgi:hypothetical protein
MLLLEHDYEYLENPPESPSVTETYSSALGLVLLTVAFESPGQYDAHCWLC